MHKRQPLMTKADAIAKMNTDHELFLGSREGWLTQYGTETKASKAVQELIDKATELHERRNARYGTTGKLIIRRETLGGL